MEYRNKIRKHRPYLASSSLSQKQPNPSSVMISIFVRSFVDRNNTGRFSGKSWSPFRSRTAYESLQITLGNIMALQHSRRNAIALQWEDLVKLSIALQNTELIRKLRTLLDVENHMAFTARLVRRIRCIQLTRARVKNVVYSVPILWSSTLEISEIIRNDETK